MPRPTASSLPSIPFRSYSSSRISIPESIEARWQAMVASATRLGVGALLLAPDDNDETVLGAAAARPDSRR